jgi:uncharacterized sulfatase
MKQIALNISCLLLITFFFSCSSKKSEINLDSKPNILWITCEDITTMLGCYGDPNALTPNLDKLAEAGIQFNTAYSTAAVCSPARSCLVTGVYATSLGTQNLRSEFKIPNEIRTLPHILRENGYYCSNNYKEDYNFTDTTIWDESSHTAHWRNRPKNKPFFSVFNFETTHQSQIFGDDESFEEKYGKLLRDEQRHHPEDIQLAPYYFDSPEVRKLWARYYDLVTIMDQQVADILDQLKEDGLEGNTIIFYFSDHGTGMPRAKRALYNSGVKVPFIVFIPEKFRNSPSFSSGKQSNRMVSFIDFPPTVLSLVGLEKPAYMQGIPFLGKHQSSTGKYAFATSDRVDEAFELSRTAKSSKYSYIRNFLPHLPLIQPNFYSDQSEIMKELYRYKDLVGYAGLTESQQSMWHPRRAPEELYDLENDPFEVVNLATNEAYKDILLEMRNAMVNWMIKTHDTGLVPEGYLVDKTRIEPAYTVAQRQEIYPIESILQVNNMILEHPIDEMGLLDKLSDPRELIRYWAAISLHYLDSPAQSTTDKLNSALADPSLLVRLAAAESLCAFNKSNSGVEQTILDGLNSVNEVEMLYASRIYELHQTKLQGIQHKVQKFHKEICARSDGKWKGYDLYSCWALTEAFKPVGK